MKTTPDRVSVTKQHRGTWKESILKQYVEQIQNARLTQVSEKRASPENAALNKSNIPQNTNVKTQLLRRP